MASACNLPSFSFHLTLPSIVIGLPSFDFGFSFDFTMPACPLDD